MYYLLIEINKTIVDINDQQPTKVQKDDYTVWRSNNKDDIFDDNYTCIEVEEIPDGLVPQKYCYSNGQFTLNPNFNEEKGLSHVVGSLNIQVTSLGQKGYKINQALIDHTNSQVETELDIDYRLSLLELGLV